MDYFFLGSSSLLETQAAHKVDAEITKTLSKIQTPWHCEGGSSKNITGFLYKKQRSKGGWRLYYFVLSGNFLYYYTNERTKKPRGILAACFVSNLLETKETQLLEFKSQHVSKYHIQLFSPNRLDMLCAETDAEIEKWYNAIHNVIKDNLPPLEYDLRNESVTKLQPLLAQKSNIEMARLMKVLSELEHSGLATKAKKEKSGNLEMLEEPEEIEGEPQQNGLIMSPIDGDKIDRILDKPEVGVWVKYYFVLQGKAIYYYKTTKSPPKGVITLKFTTVEKSHDGSGVFRLSTPISQFVLRAKHDIAASEWVDAIRTSQSPSKLMLAHSSDSEKDSLIRIDVETEIGDLTLVDEYVGFGKKVNPQLTILPPGVETSTKTRALKLNLGSTVLGRSDSSTIKIEDRKVSRSHAKIEVTESHAYILDLGSGHGTKVNRKEISKHLLRHGDKIKIGQTVILFEVVPKK